MKKFVWLAGALLVFSLLFPNGISLPTRPDPSPPAPTPVNPAPPEAEKDAKISEILANAARVDRARIYDVYTALATITRRDNGKRVNTTEKWAELQANTLQLAIDTPGKYPGLDVAIEAVFARVLGTDDVLAITPEISARLVTAAEVIAASAK
jgi:hypothetical protein